MQEMFKTKAYQTISEFYGKNITIRSGVQFINHIDEGLFILQHLNASASAKEAYCLHPLIQEDKDLGKNWREISNNFPSNVVLLVFEYRNIANSFLSSNSKLQEYSGSIPLWKKERLDLKYANFEREYNNELDKENKDCKFLEKYNDKEIKEIFSYGVSRKHLLDSIKLSPINDVNNMLVADKIQNRKDFELFHKGKHQNTDILELYFNLWLEKLDITESHYNGMIKVVEFNMKERLQNENQ